MNYFYRIPFCIGILPNLKQFVITGNNIKNIRNDIIRCGTPRILTHMRQITNSTNVNTRELLQSSTSIGTYPDKYVNINLFIDMITYAEYIYYMYYIKKNIFVKSHNFIYIYIYSLI